MENRTTYIDASLLVSPSSFLTDERVREFQRGLYFREANIELILSVLALSYSAEIIK